MIGQRLKQLRMSRGFSLDALAAELGGIVTKQALSKYEQGKIRPSPVVLNKLASTLGIKVSYLFKEPTIQVKFIAYRKVSRLPKKEQLRVECLVKEALEDRIRLQQLTNQANGSHIPIQSMRVKTIEDVEAAAQKLRTQWELGVDPISSVTDILEAHFIHVLPVNADDKFDGIAAVAYSGNHHVMAAAVVTRGEISGERQRLNLTHELGHLVLDMPKNLDEEKTAFRFGAAFLAPAEVVYREVGTKRGFMQPEELLLLKRYFGMSIQALLYRLRDLGIITESHYKQWCMDISRLSWRKQEPLELKPERAKWLRQKVLRAFAEGVITLEDAERMLGDKLNTKQPLSLIERRAFMKLPTEERRRILVEQAGKMVAYYEQHREWEELQGGDVIEY
ncbi:helix-turn-helix domain-containing protein [Candidatus Acetothermia bacterium]|nr:helix-turn-helix domain-containing protein [Candidatus Acetothermia bacterium]